MGGGTVNCPAALLGAFRRGNNPPVLPGEEKQLYNDLKDPSVSGFFRFLARIGDGVMKMQIVRIKFGGR